MSVLGVNERGVPGAVLPGVSLGLTSFEGGCESVGGPTVIDGCCLGWDGTGDEDLCGVMISAGVRAAAAEVTFLPAFCECVAAGVSGGECTADVGGECLGES
jgi:hypothetical protein